MHAVNRIRSAGNPLSRIMPLSVHWPPPSSGLDDLPLGEVSPSDERMSDSPRSPSNPPLDPPEIPDDNPLPFWRMQITQSAYRELMTYLLSREPEAAGILLGPTLDELLVTHFVPDAKGKGSPTSFELHTPSLNRLLKERKIAGLTCKGLAHTHPLGMPQPSAGDLRYFRKLFSLPTNATATSVLTPIVCGGRLYGYVFSRDQMFPCDVVLV